MQKTQICRGKTTTDKKTQSNKTNFFKPRNVAFFKPRNVAFFKSRNVAFCNTFL